ncbi:hypothetical protein FACS1894130_03300 [Spirochaetia bacterium]|nr:hypothetical protein FACS1894130_03300 [Spirochaetia bacterium]
MIPAHTLEPMSTWLRVFRQALPTAVYCSILLTLSYSSRRHIPIPMTIICLCLLSGLFSLGLSLGLHRVIAVESPAAAAPRPTLGEPGLILSLGETTMVVLGNPAEAGGPRVVSIPTRPLIYQSVPKGPQNTILELPPAPFHNEEFSLISGLFLDFSLVAEQFAARLQAGIIPFCLYLGGLCLFLVSFRFVFGLTSWPLANVFLGALVFRGILAFETFLDSEEIQTFIIFFLGGVSPEIINPAVYCALGLIISLNTILISAARGRKGIRNG